MPGLGSWLRGPQWVCAAMALPLTGDLGWSLANPEAAPQLLVVTASSQGGRGWAPGALDQLLGAVAVSVLEFLSCGTEILSY